MRKVILLGAILLLAACAGTPTAPSAATPPDDAAHTIGISVSVGSQTTTEGWEGWWSVSLPLGGGERGGGMGGSGN